MKILYKYSISLDLLKNVGEYELREHKIKIDSETEKSIKFFYGRSRILKKEKLNKVDTIFDEKSYDFMSYFIYCWEDDIVHAKESLMSKISNGLKNRATALEKLNVAFEAGYKFKAMKQLYD